MGYMVKGAGSSESGNNPKVTSKFDRSHGMPRKPGTVTHPGGTAPVTGTKVSGFSEHGHALPKEMTRPRGDIKEHHFPAEDMGHAMADGHKFPHTHNTARTDALDAKGYVGPDRGHGPSEK